MLQASVDLIAAREELRAGGSTDRLDVVVFKANSRGGNGIDIGRFDDVLKNGSFFKPENLLYLMVSNIIVSVIINYRKHNIWSVRLAAFIFQFLSQNESQ